MATKNSTTEPQAVIWYWSNTDDIHSISMKWTVYNDIENRMIEQAYQKRELSIVISNCRIDFKNMVQINNNEENKQQLVKRVTKNGDQGEKQLREDRFHPAPVVIASFHNNQKWGSKFISKWYDDFMQMHRNGGLDNIDTEYAIFLMELEIRYEHYLRQFPDDIKNNPGYKGHSYDLLNFDEDKFSFGSWRCPECITLIYLDLDSPCRKSGNCIRCFKCFEKEEGRYNQRFDNNLEEQRRKSPNIPLDIDVLKAAQRGILNEGVVLGEEREAKLIREELNTVIRRAPSYIKLPWTATVDANELRKLCARLYTKQSFLYEVVNKSLRDQDLSKCDKLGPFCYLLYDYTTNQRKPVIPTKVYRGVTLTEDQIHLYESFVGKGYMKWLGFTSTSRNPDKAKQFGNTLFVIELCSPFWRIGADISSDSYFPREEEVLLPDGVMFKITDINPNSGTNKRTIHLKIDRKAL